MNNSEEEKLTIENRHIYSSILIEMIKLLDEAEDIYNDSDNEELEDTYRDIRKYRDILGSYQNVKIKNIDEAIILKAKNDLINLKSLLLDMKDIYEENDDESLEKTEKDIRKEQIESLKNTYGLDEFEVEEVLKGNADPFEFEEDDMDEGDYYYDDDK